MLESYAVDIEMREKIEELKRINSVATLPGEKKGIVRGLKETAAEIGVALTIEYIVKGAIPALLKESDALRKLLVDQVLKIAEFIKDTPEGYAALKDSLVPSFASLIVDQNNDIRELSCAALIKVTQFLRGEDRGVCVLPIIFGTHVC